MSRVKIEKKEKQHYSTSSLQVNKLKNLMRLGTLIKLILILILIFYTSMLFSSDRTFPKIINNTNFKV